MCLNVLPYSGWTRYPLGEVVNNGSINQNDIGMGIQVLHCVLDVV